MHPHCQFMHIANFNFFRHTHINSLTCLIIIVKMYLKVLRVRDISKTHALPVHTYTCTVKARCYLFAIPKASCTKCCPLPGDKMNSSYLVYSFDKFFWASANFVIYLNYSLRTLWDHQGFCTTSKLPKPEPCSSGWTNVARLCAQLWGSSNHSLSFQRVYKFY